LALYENAIIGAILMGDVSDARWMQTLIDEKRDVLAYGSRMLDGGVDLKELAQGALP
jgi:NAD(P)H-nitrite reductase large subunit